MLSDKRHRWLINIVLAVAVISFAGIGVIAPFTASLGNNPSADSAPASPTATTSQEAELAEQARGYELVLQREPDNQTALRGLLDIRIQTGDVEGAIAPLEKLAQLNPDQTDYTVLLAQARQQTGDREGAAQAYRSVLATKPGDLNALQGLVGLMLEQERPESAIGLLQDTLQTAPQANQLQPGSIDANSVRLLLGQVYAQQNRYEEAIAVYDEAIQGDRQDFRPVLAKAIVLRTQGNDEEAQPLFTTAASLAPDQYRDQINQIAAGETTAPSGAPTAPDATVPETAPDTSSEAAPEPAPSASPEAPAPAPTASP